MAEAIHPAPLEFSPEQIATDPVLRFFHYAHLPQTLQEASAVFCGVANYIVNMLPRNAERSAALRKLLEAKDCAVRANIVPAPPADNVDDPNIRERGEYALRAGHQIPEAPPAATFQERLAIERKELADRVEKLAAFNEDTAKFSALDVVQQDLLGQQLSIMDRYLRILDRRIALLNRKNDDQQQEDSSFQEDGDVEVRVTGGDRSEEAIPFEG